MTSGRDRYVHLNGLRLHYLEWGSAANPALVLCHGGSAFAHWWDFFAPAFARDFHVIAPDWRGHGDSQHAEHPAYSTRHYVDDLDQLIRAVGLARPVLLGHSMGGHNALIYATEHSPELRALILVDIEPSYPESAVRFLRRLGQRPARVFESFQAAVASFRLLPRGSRLSVDKLRYLASFAFKELPDGRWTAKLDRRALFREPLDGWPLLPRITCPTLVVKAERSPVLSSQKLDRMCALLPDGRGLEVPDTQHHVMLDNPDGFVAAVSNFLERV